MTVFIDGNLNYPSCRCKPDCEFPCWQMVGLSDEPCGPCGCDPFESQPPNAGRVAEDPQPTKGKATFVP